MAFVLALVYDKGGYPFIPYVCSKGFFGWSILIFGGGGGRGVLLEVCVSSDLTAAICCHEIFIYQ